MAHWYDRLGNCRHTIIGSNGIERDTTLRDAKKHNLVYSVSDVISKAAKPALGNWQLNQLVKSFRETSSKKLDETQENYEKRVWNSYNEMTGYYKQYGDIVHKQLDNYFKGLEVKPDYIEMAEAVATEIKKISGAEIISESVFVDKRGFGGTIDLILGSNDVIIDFKTKQGDLTQLQIYDDNVIQLSAYRQAKNPKADCYNIYISATHEGAIKVVKWTEKELERGWKIFECLLEYTKLVNNYRSEW